MENAPAVAGVQRQADAEIMGSVFAEPPQAPLSQLQASRRETIQSEISLLDYGHPVQNHGSLRRRRSSLVGRHFWKQQDYKNGSAAPMRPSRSSAARPEGAQGAWAP